ncbi:hypothetical protein CDAR_571541 [Caerostris darwini]|uniref:Uncharacterized protein n=1 Tax=Caerostris darwini TaxID=1538125 RepID=A0AAV4WDE1_9ARAC|nr:hypothetical protein CDAR_571541 [Caerostris darwini]
MYYINQDETTQDIQHTFLTGVITSQKRTWKTRNPLILKAIFHPEPYKKKSRKHEKFTLSPSLSLPERGRMNESFIYESFFPVNPQESTTKAPKRNPRRVTTGGRKKAANLGCSFYSFYFLSSLLAEKQASTPHRVSRNPSTQTG